MVWSSKLECRIGRYAELYPCVHKGLLFRLVLGRSVLDTPLLCQLASSVVPTEMSTTAGVGGVCCRRGIG